MRHIDLSQLYLPEEWNEYSQDLLEELKKKKKDERSETLKKPRFKNWTLLIPLLRQISHNKCFYSERRLDHGINEVDHFRPKAAIYKADLKQGIDHSGYWWLAFLHTNFRLSAPQCNKFSKDRISGETSGKGTRFPIGGVRAIDENDSLDAEIALLLDPTCADDTKLITFNDIGQVQPSNKDKNSIDYLRAKTSIRCYYLDEPSMQTRRGECCTKAKAQAQLLEELLENKDSWGREDKRRIVEIKIELHRSVQDDAEYASAVRCVLRSFNYLPFIADLLRPFA